MLIGSPSWPRTRSEEHTSELQSHRDLHSFPTRRSSDLLALAAGVVVGHDQPAATVEKHAVANAHWLPFMAANWARILRASGRSSMSGTSPITAFVYLM